MTLAPVVETASDCPGAAAGRCADGRRIGLGKRVPAGRLGRGDLPPPAEFETTLAGAAVRSLRVRPDCRGAERRHRRAVPQAVACCSTTPRGCTASSTGATCPLLPREDAEFGWWTPSPAGRRRPARREWSAAGRCPAVALANVGR
ncbi:hypothetical protein HBB16_21730 [Pseudonocardia sp. MCCB 268]|nr:hypothetical protein [Pseudonocardia cytotoxica]